MAMDLVARLRVKDDGFSRGFQTATGHTKALAAAAGQTNSAVDRLTAASGRAGGSLQRMSSSAGRAFGGMVQHAGKVTAAVAGIGIAAGAVAVGAGALKLITDSLKGASDIEQNNVAMEHFIGLTQGAEKAKTATKSYVDYLEKNANLTPFETGDVMNAGRRLINVTSGDIGMAQQLLTVSENMAALNPGKSLMDATEALADMKTGEFERMKEFGFKISAEDVKKAGGGANGALKLMLTSVAKTFDGGADKLSKTSLGMWSTITGTFKTGISHMGTDTLKLLNPQLERMAKYLSDGGADKMFAAGSRMMARAVDGISKGVDKAINYVKTHFTDNPDFMRLDAKGKIEFAFADINKTFRTWYDSGGNQQVKDATSSLVGYVSDALSGSSDKLRDIGIDLGKSVGSGMLAGLEKFTQENAKLAAVMTYIATPGSPQVKLAAAGFTAVTAFDTPAVQKATEVRNDPVQQKSAYEKLNEQGRYSESIPMWIGDRLRDITKPAVQFFTGSEPKVDGSHAGGLSRVPYDGYRAKLHAGERIQTKAEADTWRSGGNGGGKGGNTFIIHNNISSDVDANAFMRKMAALMNEGAPA